MKRIISAGAAFLLALGVLFGVPTPASATPRDAADPSGLPAASTQRPPANATGKTMHKPYTANGVKYKPPADPNQPHVLTGESRDYSIASLALSNTGAYANINQVNPFVTNADLTGTHSLAEIALEDTAQSNIIEIGWRKTAADTAPKLFVYSWVNGVGQGYGTNFTLYGARTWSPGDTVTTGSAKQYRWQYESTTTCGSDHGAWWFQYDATWVGWYCANLFPVGTSLRNGTSDFGQWFFENVYDTTRGFFCSDQGSGTQGSSGSAGLPDIGYISSMAMLGQPTTNPPFNPYIRTSPTTATHITVNIASNRTFYGGGPGKNSTGTGVGSKGSC